MTVIFVVPALKASGGVREILRLADEIAATQHIVSIVSMWSAAHTMPNQVAVEHLSQWRPRLWAAFFQIPLLFLRFLNLVGRRARCQSGKIECFIFTHYVTLPLSLLVPRRRRFFFVQDLEWKFIGNKIASSILRKIILSFYRSGTIISTNDYLVVALKLHGLKPEIVAPIWADKAFYSKNEGLRDIDYVMVLRKGAHKRLDLYLDFIRAARTVSGLRLAVISPDDEAVEYSRDQVVICLIRPSTDQMKQLYARSKVFIHLSDHEGFGLPPLEAMGFGCVPLCRDSGGIRSYMQDDLLSRQIVPPNEGVAEIFRRGQDLLGTPLRLDQLSHRSREVFMRGLERSNERSAAVHAICSRASRV